MDLKLSSFIKPGFKSPMFKSKFKLLINIQNFYKFNTVNMHRAQSLTHFNISKDNAPIIIQKKKKEKILKFH